jgi:hypothetical protein
LTAFHYSSGEQVTQGDRISHAGWEGVVELVILPGSEDAAAYQAPQGGILVRDDGHGLVLLAPPDREQWEDLDFVGRSSEQGINP